MVDNDCMILAQRCWERDRQYQNNNNCELDNGVYNKFVNEGKPKEDDESAIMSDEEEELKMIEKGFKKKLESKEKSELEELEQMIENKNKEDWSHGRSISS